jgi:hypothetical protein
VTLVAAGTFAVVMLKIAEVAPAGTVTVAGTVAAALELVKATTAPPGGAGPFRYTLLAVDGTPPTNAVGDRYSDDNATGLTISVPGLVTPPYAAEIVTLVAAATFVVFTVKVAVVAPAATVTVAGTVAAALELVKATTAPPDGAGPFK